MKIETNPQTGKTTCELWASERETIAKAKTILEQLAFYYRDESENREFLPASGTMRDILADPELCPKKENA